MLVLTIIYACGGQTVSSSVYNLCVEVVGFGSHYARPGFRQLGS